MKKTLRFTLLSMLLMLCGNAMAQKTVTIDINNDVATIFPTITSYSSGTGSSYVADGEFTENTTSAAIDGVTLTVSASAADAQNRNRLWATNPRLRMYDGTLTIASAGEKITKMEITRSTNKGLVANDNTVDTGTLTQSDQQQNGVVEWAGEAQQVVMTIAGNTQFSKIVVTLGGDPGTVTPEDPNKKGSVNNPYTVAEAQALLATLAPNVKSDEIYLKGVISKIDEVSVDYGNATYYISDSGSEEGQLEVFRGKYLENTSFTSADQIKVSDVVVIVGQLVNYRSSKAAETDPVTPEVNQGNYIYSLNGKTKAEGGETPVDPVAETITVTRALEIIDALEDGAKTDETYQVKGFVVSVTEISAQFGNATFIMADDKTATTGLTVFRTKGFNGENITNEQLLKVGDEVVVEAKLQKYLKNGETIPETVQQGAKIISINGKTSDGGETPVEIETISVEQALDMINEELQDGQSTSVSYYVPGFVVGAPEFQRKDDGSLYGNANFQLADEKDGEPTITVFRAKYFDNVPFTEETVSALNEGDEVVVCGKLQRYVKNDVMTPEISSCYLYSINGQSSSIAAVEMQAGQAAVFNLQGQRVVSMQRGLYIIGGKKYLVK